MNDRQDLRVSAIVPARNEAANIARVVRSLAEQEGLLEILVVDDQSTDLTGAILATLATEIPILHVLRVESLPEGWMGKTYAVSLAAKAAAGNWLLFTDADTEHLPGSLPSLLNRAQAERVDLLSVSPGQETPTWWEKSVIPMIFLMLASLFRFEEVGDPNSPAAAANGQYILIRREIYERSGGHSAVKNAILEDVELARRVKALGGRLLFLPGAPWIRTRMYCRFGEMWQGWTKNLYLLYQENLSKMFLEMMSLWLLDLFPVLAFLVSCIAVAMGNSGGVAARFAVVFFLVALARQWKYARDLGRLGFDPALANFQPLGAALTGALMVSSMYAHRASGGIVWKGRHYATRGKG